MNIFDLNSGGGLAGGRESRSSGWFSSRVADIRHSRVFSFRGRISRRDYWIAVGLAHLMGWIGNLVLYMYSDLVGDSLVIAPLILDLVLLALYGWLLSAALAKRFHDLNLSGWMALGYLLLFLLYSVLFILQRSYDLRSSGWMVLLLLPLYPGLLILQGSIKGTIGPNRYGADPLAMNEAASALRPPRLHWGWVLALNFLTLFQFYGMWLIVQSNWSRKVRGRSVAFPMAIVLLAAQLGFLFVLPDPDRYAHRFMIFGFWIAENSSGWVAICWLIAVSLPIANLFILRNELTKAAVDVLLSGPMTFFFGPVYFQYHLFDYEGPVGEALAAHNICDTCKTTFPNFHFLTQVEGQGYLCDKCRLALAEAPQPEA